MHTWARRGLQTALVTGGLLMVGTGIASADESITPDLPIDPVQPATVDQPALQAREVATTSPGTEETDSLTNMYSTAGGPTVNGFDNYATTTGGDVGTLEWRPLSGDLLPEPSTDMTQIFDVVPGDPPPDPTNTEPTGPVFRVPGDVLGSAVRNDEPIVAFVDDDPGPRFGHYDPYLGPQDEPEFGPSDLADSLLRADQVPTLAELFTVPRLPGLPIADPHLTQVFPAIGQNSAPELTPPAPVPPVRRSVPPVFEQSAPVRSYQPMSGELPVAGALPARSAGLTALPDLPPVPTLPGMPAIERPSTQDAPVPLPPVGTSGLSTPNLNATHLSTPRLAMPQLPTPSAPTVSSPLVSGLGVGPVGPQTPQDAPAGAAAQLMAQLRGLIRELESAGGRDLHPMDVTAWHEPPTL